jgi:FlaG/FlaF family flagellin (archaellin)
MKNDILTIAIVVFVAGVLASSVGLSDVFEADEQNTPPALHQGVTLR